MRLENIDWTGREWTAALVAEAKSKLEHPMMAIVAPGVFSDLMTQGYEVGRYKTAFPFNTQDITQFYQDGDLVWHTLAGVPDDVLILSNLDAVITFYGFKWSGFERAEDQMPLWLAQRKGKAAAK